MRNFLDITALMRGGKGVSLIFVISPGSIFSFIVVLVRKMIPLKIGNQRCVLISRRFDFLIPAADNK